MDIYNNQFTNIFEFPLQEEKNEEKKEPFISHHRQEGCFDYVEAYREIYYVTDYIPQHDHDFYELIYCRNCYNVEYLVGTEVYHLRSGDILFIPPGISHHPVFPEDMSEPYVQDLIWFRPKFKELLELIYPNRRYHNFAELRPWHITDAEAVYLEGLFQNSVKEYKEKTMGWESIIFANTIQIVFQLNRILIVQNALTEKMIKPNLTDQVIAYVESHLSEKLTLENVAQHFYTSKSTISQSFRKKLGISFHQFVINSRLNVAKSLMNQGMALENVSQLVGFSDYSAFYRAFKHEFGISPTEYRNVEAFKDKTGI